MRAVEYSALLDWFEAYLGEFRENGRLHPMQELKRAHSLRVAENAALLAAGLRLRPGEQRLARAAGLLHDAGRFSQFRDHGSLSDAVTTDHGAQGRAVLEKFAAGLVGDKAEWEDLLAAVQFHNRRTADIPPLPKAAAALLGLLRDADKLDIMEVVLRSVAADGFRDLPAMLPHMSPGRGLTPGLVEKARSGQGLATGELRTAADMLLMAACWFDDLNLPGAHQLAARRGLLARLREELPADPEVDLLFAGIEGRSRAAAAGTEEKHER
ncbi:MAG: HD domain-containing protein [Elusimicrobiales bacterium]